MTAVLLRSAPAGREGLPADPVAVFRALSDPLRWQLLGHLCRRTEMPRAELERALGVSKTMLSYHTRALLQAGLIDVRGSARALTYAVRRDAVADLEQWLDDPRSAAASGEA
ncbi:helix-turn-helix transcriptional regulator [Blastococcus sp. URHD0036]|uniref:ArsR/SmtB family transcription factor n=1 Tax=Blastococcus sp. URHD0036 TaxID=1380356 RepID=UPI00068EF481|nr:metalloregulator ArsR/SmtB family transcription factor [Blastococcus sp. URHD0036]